MAANDLTPPPTPVVFLDVDGVLIPHGDNDWDELDPACVARLIRILKCTGAQVVLSSLWRHSLAKRRRLEAVGIPISGVTPFVAAEPRATEIARWLREAQARDGVQPPFVILDDNDDAKIEGHFIPIKSLTGIAKADADNAIAHLRGGQSA